MQNYTLQLRHRLTQSAQNPPPTYPYHIDHPLGEGNEWISELAHTPYKPLEEWVGVQKVEFPPAEKLKEGQMALLVEGMDEVLGACNFAYDCREELSRNVALHYQVLVGIWDEEVQYLPEAGFDIDICAGTSAKCWLNVYCFCLYDPPDVEFEEHPQPHDADKGDFPF